MSTKPAPAAILWDMDGTLIDSEPIWDVAVSDFATRHGLAMDADLRESTLGNSLPDAMGKVYDAAGIGDGDRDAAADARWLLDHVTDLFNAGLPWRPGAQEALDAVADAGVAMVLVTNTVRELTEVALATIGRGRFTATVCGDEVPMGKPAPFPYLRAADLLGYAPHACLVVEDSPTGAASASAAGCPALIVPSAVAVDDGPGRVFRDSLVGVDTAELADAWQRALAVR
ncbi:putative hydrolase [Gordonia araii NBRC 100433]|uniref:Putative hydrolase n=1 Tax=Gordonia araii NBRC 100433 TaxID=1073574 RepID=G7H0J6_9ACTN|nr:HAD family hydrolase [Gordonia araii]GAB09371.1 putative hydrolase [Gordonia araii NBRC 100433]